VRWVRRRFALMTIVACASARGGADEAPRSDDAAADFSPLANPAGPWSWGWMPRGGGVFTRAQNYPSNAHVDVWRGAGGSMVLYNRTSRLQSLGTGTWPPRQLGLHPGEGGEWAVVRWTAQRAGVVRVVAAFTRRDHAYPTTTDVHVLRDGAPVFEGALDLHRSRAPFESLASVRAGLALDFAVGWGANQRWHGDSTGLDVRIAWVQWQR
jgi:hypothetical protein